MPAVDDHGGFFCPVRPGTQLAAAAVYGSNFLWGGEDEVEGNAGTAASADDDRVQR